MNAGTGSNDFRGPLKPLFLFICWLMNIQINTFSYSVIHKNKIPFKGFKILCIYKINPIQFTRRKFLGYDYTFDTNRTTRAGFPLKVDLRTDGTFWCMRKEQSYWREISINRMEELTM